MNTINNQQIPMGLSSGTIADFPFLTQDALTSLSDALSLKMGLAELRFCQNYYKNERLANPTVDELKITDRVFYDRSKQASAFLIASFMTNDKTVADTYADLMVRRKAVTPDYSAPCSVREMLDILPSYIKAASGNESPEARLFSGKNRILDAAAQRHRKVVSNGEESSDSVIGVKIKNDRASAPVAGDAIYAVLSSFNNTDGFNKQLEDFVSSAEALDAAKQIIALDGQCVITALAELNMGIRLNTMSYEARSASGFPFEHLTDSDRGVIITASKESAADMLIAAQEIGLRVILLGSLDSSNKITTTSTMGVKLSLNTGLLNALKFARPFGCEADGKENNTLPRESSIYVGINGKRYKFSGAAQGGKNAFVAGFNSVLYSYSLTIAGGESDIIGAGAYTLPLNEPTEKALGESVELILGAYRAQCEFGVCDYSPSIEYGESASLKFHTLSPTKSNIPAKICGKDTYIFYLEPIYLENGLPDFEDLKKMHGYIGKLINDGIILSIRPTGEDLIATLDKMSEDTCVEYLRRDELKSHVGGFIVETTQKIQGAFIAKTAPETLESTTESAHFSL